MPEITAQQVSFLPGGAIVAGPLTNDQTKVVVAALHEPAEAIQLAIAVAAGVAPVLDIDEDDVQDILEKPGKGFIGGE